MTVVGIEISMDFRKDSQPAVNYSSSSLPLTALITEEISTTIVFIYPFFLNNFILPSFTQAVTSFLITVFCSIWFPFFLE